MHPRLRVDKHQLNGVRVHNVLKQRHMQLLMHARCATQPPASERHSPAAADTAAAGGAAAAWQVHPQMPAAAQRLCECF
jgi:hypothetical protein